MIDFDGVLHSYTSGWKGVDQIPDPPVPGFAEFLGAAVRQFDVRVFSSRSAEPSGRTAMREWLVRELVARFRETMDGAAAIQTAYGLIPKIGFPVTKPAAFVTLDDRAVTFTGVWPALDELAKFRPWWARDDGKDGE